MMFCVDWRDAVTHSVASEPMNFHRLLTQLVHVSRRIEYRAPALLSRPIILEQLAIHAHIVTLDRQRGLRRLGVDDKVVVTVGAVLVAVVKLLGVLAKALFAFLAGKRHFKRLHERVRLAVFVALCAVEPSAACSEIRS